MDVMEEAVGVCRTFVAARVADGERPFVERLAHHGGWSRWDRIQTWLTDRRDQFTERPTLDPDRPLRRTVVRSG